jgi:hypothetical protein
MRIDEWLGLDESRWQQCRQFPAEPAHTDPAASTVAIGLCCTSATLQSMTPAQRDVFLTLVRLQLECGFHTLLPNVMEELLWLAQQPWWDKGVAGIADEGS